jgi:hypothetical protein
MKLYLLSESYPFFALLGKDLNEREYRYLPFQSLIDIDNDLMRDIINKTNISVKKGGFSLSSGVWEEKELNVFSINTYLSHTHFHYLEVIITLELKNDCWQAKFTKIDEEEWLNDYFSKPLSLPFRISNLPFEIEYWYTPYVEITIWEITHNENLSDDDFLEIKEFYKKVYQKWDWDDASIDFKICDINTYRVLLNFDYGKKYQDMKELILKLSKSKWGKQIKKLTFEWEM